MPINIDFDQISPMLRFMAGDATVTAHDANGIALTGAEFRGRIATAQKYDLTFALDVDVDCEFTTTHFLQGDNIVLDIPAIEAVCP